MIKNEHEYLSLNQCINIKFMHCFGCLGKELYFKFWIINNL